jgi:predicted dehydrogenase
MPVVAFLGCAHIHVPGFINMIKKRSNVRVKYTFDDIVPARAEKRANELGAAAVTDVRQLLDDAEVDGVIICSETNRHGPQVAATAAAKKHLFVEKPLGTTAADSVAMADAIEKAGVKFQTGYFMRSDPKVRFIKDQIAAGAFGQVTRVRGSNCHHGSLGGWFDDKPNDPANNWRWMADPQQSGCGAFGDLGTHSLDLMLWLGGPVKTVFAQLDPVTARYGKATDETGEALLRYQSGAIGTLAAAWVDWANPASLIVSGTEAHAAIVNNQLLYTSKKHPQFDGSAPVRNSELPAGLPHAFELWLDALEGKDVPLVPVREAAYRVQVMEAMYRSAREGAAVNV